MRFYRYSRTVQGSLSLYNKQADMALQENCMPVMQKKRTGSENKDYGFESVFWDSDLANWALVE